MADNMTKWAELTGGDHVFKQMFLELLPWLPDEVQELGGAVYLSCFNVKQGFHIHADVVRGKHICVVHIPGDYFDMVDGLRGRKIPKIFCCEHPPDDFVKPILHELAHALLGHHNLPGEENAAVQKTEELMQQYHEKLSRQVDAEPRTDRARR